MIDAITVDVENSEKFNIEFNIDELQEIVSMIKEHPDITKNHVKIVKEAVDVARQHYIDNLINNPEFSREELDFIKVVTQDKLQKKFYHTILSHNLLIFGHNLEANIKFYDNDSDNRLLNNIRRKVLEFINEEIKKGINNDNQTTTDTGNNKMNIFELLKRE
jgi:hypothetical protein